MTTDIVFRNGRFLVSNGSNPVTTSFSNCMIVVGECITFVGDESEPAVQAAKDRDTTVVDLNNRIVIPGFIDSHTHLLMFGLSIQKLDLTECQSLEAIRAAISEYAKDHPELTRILCRGWHQPHTGGLALASNLDDLDPRPIYVEALDLHSSWCSTSALEELPIERMLATCPQHIQCDSNGKPNGLISEIGQVAFVMPYLIENCTATEKSAALDEAFGAYVSGGYTGAIDMAMDAHTWEALKEYRRTKSIPLHIGAHWLIAYEEDEELLMKHVDEAISMNKEWEPSQSPEFCVVGIKIISDGVVDGCTAALSHPYGESADLTKPMWPAKAMQLVVEKAAKSGLQCAIHAIGDAAVKQAIDAIASVGDAEGRHRIEHLEITSEEDANRLGRLGITASIQPVHSDPEILKAYRQLVGHKTWERAFAYKEFFDGHAHVALGTDSPTAKHHAFPNLYNATTRKSAMNPLLNETTNVHNALTLSQAITAATTGAAYSRFAENWTGRLKAGLRADFVVIDSQWEPESLLETSIHQTWSRGVKLFEADP